MSNEWFTPAKYIEAAREVMGSIDLDPASCYQAQKTVRATIYYDKEENGLEYNWHGRVWLNPPFGLIHAGVKGSTKSWQRSFVEKAQYEYEIGNSQQVIILLLGSTVFRTYFQALWKYPVCLNPIQTKFYREDGSTSQFGFGSLFVYLGPNEQRFLEVFSKFGRIVKAIDTPLQSQHVLPASLWEPINKKEVI